MGRKKKVFEKKSGIKQNRRQYNFKYWIILWGVRGFAIGFVVYPQYIYLTKTEKPSLSSQQNIYQSRNYQILEDKVKMKSECMTTTTTKQIQSIIFIRYKRLPTNTNINNINVDMKTLWMAVKQQLDV